MEEDRHLGGRIAELTSQHPNLYREVKKQTRGTQQLPRDTFLSIPHVSSMHLGVGAHECVCVGLAVVTQMPASSGLSFPSAPILHLSQY